MVVENNKNVGNSFVESKPSPSKIIPIIKFLGLFLLGCGLIEIIISLHIILGLSSEYEIQGFINLAPFYYLFSYPPIVILLSLIPPQLFMIVLFLEILLIASVIVIGQSKKEEWSNQRMYFVYLCAFLLTVLPTLVPEITLLPLLTPATEELSVLANYCQLTVNQVIQAYWGLLSWLTVWFFFLVQLLTRKNYQHDNYFWYFWLGWLLLQTIIVVLVPTYRITFILGE